MKKFFSILTLIFSATTYANIPSAEFISNENGVDIYRTNSNLFIIDGMENFGRLGQVNVDAIGQDEQAIFVIIPAHKFSDLNANISFAQHYTVDCYSNTAVNEKGNFVQIMDMNAVYQNASKLACATLEEWKLRQ